LLKKPVVMQSQPEKWGGGGATGKKQMITKKGENPSEVPDERDPHWQPCTLGA